MEISPQSKISACDSSHVFAAARLFKAKLREPSNFSPVHNHAADARHDAACSLLYYISILLRLVAIQGISRLLTLEPTIDLEPKEAALRGRLQSLSERNQFSSSSTLIPWNREASDVVASCTGGRS